MKLTTGVNSSLKHFQPVSDAGGEFSYRSCLAPPLPPMAPTPKLRRVGSSTLSLNRTRKKLLTVIFISTVKLHIFEIDCHFYNNVLILLTSDTVTPENFQENEMAKIKVPVPA